MSMHLNPLALLADGIIIYLIILVCIKAYQKFRYKAETQSGGQNEI